VRCFIANFVDSQCADEKNAENRRIFNEFMTKTWCRNFVTQLRTLNVLFVAGPEMKLVEIVGCGPAGQHVKLAGARSVLCDLGGTDGINEYNAKLDDIELEDTHTENYLMAYTADEGLTAYFSFRDEDILCVLFA